MNRIVLIGNGFDLAHGMKTSYADFIKWYWRQVGEQLMKESTRYFEDELCSFEMDERIELAGWYLVKGYYYRSENPFERDGNKFVDWAKHWEWCNFRYKSDFFKWINQSIENKGWVDIENEYYNLLTEYALNSVKGTTFSDLGKQVNLLMEKTSPTRVVKLNKQLNFLKDKLIEYLKSEEAEKNQIEKIKEKIYRPIEEKEVAFSSKKGMIHFYESLKLNSIMLLNFNYTATPEMYLKKKAEINYIHGRINKPQSVIFGYGDELDDAYKELQKLNDNDCLRYIKSYHYLESKRYKDMLGFISKTYFQVCIMGHSCGKSDGTLLNTLFEHPNCVSVKPYYYINEKGEDNYLELVQNISRNFTDMKLMRDRVVNKEYCEPLS